MRQSSGNHRQLSGIAPTRVGVRPTDVGEATCAYLRRRHPKGTAAEVATAIAPFPIKLGTIEKMLERQSAPSGALLLALACAYGPEFLCEVLPRPPAWLDEALRAETRARIDAQIDELQRRREVVS